MTFVSSILKTFGCSSRTTRAERSDIQVGIQQAENRSKSKKIFFRRGKRNRKVKNHSNDQIDCLVKCWVNLPFFGDVPGERSGHAVTTVGGKAYLFGGCGGSSGNTPCLSDFLSFDFNTRIWKRVKSIGDGPSPRASFEMCKGPTENTLIVAGGTGGAGVCGDLFEFNVRTLKWKKLVESNSPESRCRYYGQSICPYKDHLICFGGSSGHEYTNDLYKFDLKEQKFVKLEATGTAPSPRYKHQATIIGDRMYVLGGGNYKPTTAVIDVYSLDLKTMVWSRIYSTGQVPQARVAHTCEYDPSSNCIYLWAGFNLDLERMNDFYILDLQTLRWTCISEQLKLVPSARAFHSSCLYNNSIYIFGGADGETRYSDIWKYQMRADPPSLMLLAAKTILNNCDDLRAEFSKRISDELLTAIEDLDAGIDRFHRSSTESPFS